MSERKRKRRAFISISSSDEEEELVSGSDDDEEDDNSGDCYEPDCHDFDDSVVSASTSCDNDESESDGEDSSSDNDNGKANDEEKVEAICDRVFRLLREGSQLQELNLTECKTYLRKLELRLSGTKSECVQRIKEHWRVKDGKGEAQYPRSSFNINCTGDVCKGDVVLFTQKVFQKFDKRTRSGNVVGKRIIAGRIVKESYGAAKQQHTFTVEVLWSKGFKKLPPLFPLLVKGRNLYKMKTFRQRWKNEAERSIVLAEKHKRGAAARELRAMKKSKKTLCTNAGAKGQKPFHHKSSQLNQSIEVDKGKRVHQRKNAPLKSVRLNDRHKNSLPLGQVNMKHSTKSRPSTSYRRDQNFTQPNEVRDSTFQLYCPQDFYHSQREFQNQRALLSYPFERGSTSSMMRLPHSRPYVDYYTMPVSEHQGLNHGSYPHYAYSNPIQESRARNFSGFPRLMDTYRPLHPLPYRTETHGQRRHGF